MCIGKSGSLKSPAQKMALKPIYNLDQEAEQRNAELKEEYESALIYYKKDLSEWNRDKNTLLPPPIKPKPPQIKQLIVSDTTFPAVAPILQANPRGILLSCDESPIFLRHFSQNGGKGGADSSQWLSTYSAMPIRINRKTGNPKTIRVKNGSISVCGGIQPDILRQISCPALWHSGLMSRFIFAYPAHKPRHFRQCEVNSRIKEKFADIFAKLYKLEPTMDQSGKPEPQIVTLSENAKEKFRQFVNRNGEEQADICDYLREAWSKLEEIPARLALLIHYIRWAEDNSDLLDQYVIEERTMEAAIRLTEWFKGETRRVYDMLIESDREAAMRNLVEWISSKNNSVTPRETKNCPPDVQERGRR